MSDASSSKFLKKSNISSSKKIKVKGDSSCSSNTSVINKKSPKSLIKKLNISKVYKGKKKLEEINKKEEIMSSSQETFIPMEEDDGTTSPVKEQQILLSQQLQQLIEVDAAVVTSPISNKDEDTVVQKEVDSSSSTLVQEDDGKLNNETSHEEQYLTDIEGHEIEQGQEGIDTKPFTGPEQSSENEAAENLKKECLYKILVIGELGTGKTSIIKRYVHQFFSQHYRATIGVDFALKVINWDPNTIIRLQLWDIAGQERFGNMTRVYYKEAVGAFIVFDVTRVATFEAVIKWKQDLDSKVQLPDGSPIPCVLLANKCDQQKEGIVNNPNKINEYCEEHKFTAWFETSAKENINIEEAAKTLVKEILNNDMTSDNGRSNDKDASKFPLDGHIESTSERKGCSC